MGAPRAEPRHPNGLLVNGLLASGGLASERLIGTKDDKARESVAEANSWSLAAGFRTPVALPC